MKKLKWLLAAFALCGAFAFLACSIDSSDSSDDSPKVSESTLKQKIVGKWIISELNGEEALTRQKIVTTFGADLKGSQSVAFADKVWKNEEAFTYTVKDNFVTVKIGAEDEIKYDITSISNTKFTAKVTATIKDADAPEDAGSMNVTFENITSIGDTYKDAIEGPWQSSEERFIFKEEGKVIYFVNNQGTEGSYERSDHFTEYFVDGKLLCLRGEDDICANMIIESLSDSKLELSYKYKDENGKVQAITNEYARVPDATAEEISKKIVGKWISVREDSKEVLTDEKVVTTFTSATEGYVSVSFEDKKAFTYADEFSATITGNVVTLTLDKGTIEYKIRNISDERIVATMTSKFKDEPPISKEVHLAKVPEAKIEFGDKIYGIWEGRSTGANGSVYDDGKIHRWEFREDGFYVYYEKGETGSWIPSSNLYNEYFVDGNLLCTRWFDYDVNELHENWEIESIEEENGVDVMTWVALRSGDTGNYTASFEVTKINPPTKEEIDKKLVGSWITSGLEDLVIPTNFRSVFTYVSDTEAYYTSSIADVPELEANKLSIWNPRTKIENFKLEDNIINLGESSEYDEELRIFEINEKEFYASFYLCFKVDDEPVKIGPLIQHYEKVPEASKNYDKMICGLWEGKCTSKNGSEYDDGETHRWEYLGDGDFFYYVQNDKKEWVQSTNRFNEYCVDANLLCTRWIDEDGEECYEWWEIEELTDKKMKWTSTRVDYETFENYTSTFEMEKIPYPTEEEIEEKIVGKWILDSRRNKPATTNMKSVKTFEAVDKTTGSGEGTNSVSIGDLPERPDTGTRPKGWGNSNRPERPEGERPDRPKPDVWQVGQKFIYSILDNVIIIGEKDTEDISRITSYLIQSIDDDEFVAIEKVLVEIKDGETEFERTRKQPVRFVRVSDEYKDYSNLIVGTWEGSCVSANASEFDDGKEHRWEYNSDGSFTYYNLENKAWVESTNKENAYFVDANLLCTRWVDANDVEHREWWEIKISTDGNVPTMTWKALRRNDKGETYTTEFELEKVIVTKTLTLTGRYDDYNTGEIINNSLEIEYTDNDTWKDIADRYDEVSIQNISLGPEGKIIYFWHDMSQGIDGCQLKSEESTYQYDLVSINDKVSAYSSYFLR